MPECLWRVATVADVWPRGRSRACEQRGGRPSLTSRKYSSAGTWDERCKQFSHEKRSHTRPYQPAQLISFYAPAPSPIPCPAPRSPIPLTPNTLPDSKLQRHWTAQENRHLPTFPWGREGTLIGGPLNSTGEPGGGGGGTRALFLLWTWTTLDPVHVPCEQWCIRTAVHRWRRGGGYPLCDIPLGCCFFTGPRTVTRSSLRMLHRVAAFCRPLRPVLLLVSFPCSWSPVVGVLGLC